MKRMSSIVLFVAVCGLFSVFAIRNVSPVAENGYRMMVVVDNSDNPETLYDFQVFLNITYDSNMQSDFDDLRFTWYDTTSDEEVSIDYWLDMYVDSEYAVVWVEVPSIRGSGQEVLYIYYGDPDAISGSNGEATFVFFDDFSADTTSNYDIVRGTGAFIWDSEDGLLEINDVQGSYIWIRQKNELLDVSDDKYWLETRAQLTGTGVPDMFSLFEFYDYTGDHSTTNPYRILAAELRDTPFAPPPEGRHFELASWYGDPAECSIWEFLVWENDVWYRWSLGTSSDGTILARLFDDSYQLMEDLICTTIHQNTNWWPGMGHNSATDDSLTSRWDYIRVRKFTDPEPTCVFATTATVNITPNTLNLKSNGQWVTAYITFPERYSAEDIVTETVKIDDIPLAWSETQDDVFMAKFDRATVQGLVNKPDYEDGTKFSELKLTVTGKLTDGTPFEGTDTVRVIIK